MRRRKYISCTNEDAHVARMEVLEDDIKWFSGRYVVADMAIRYGWKRTSGQWLCPDCIEGK